MKFSSLIPILAVLLFCKTSWSLEDSCNAMLTGALPKAFIETAVVKSEEGLTPEQKRLRNKVLEKGIQEASLDKDILKDLNAEYVKMVNLPTGRVPDQKDSGRCWIFSVLNQYRSRLVAEGIVPKGFEFSENFLLFFSLLERSNQYLDRMTAGDLRDVPDSKLTEKLGFINEKIDDGGEFRWVLFLIAKYGIVPKEAMPETYDSNNTDFLISNLRQSVVDTRNRMRKVSQDMAIRGGSYSEKDMAVLRQIKLEGMQRITNMLVTSLGRPPSEGKPFLWYADAVPKSKYGRAKFKTIPYSPRGFAFEILKFDPEEFVNFSSTPLVPYNSAYLIKDQTMGIEGPDDPPSALRYVNVVQARQIRLVVESLRKKIPVPFSGNMDRGVDVDSGVMDPRVYSEGRLNGFSDKNSPKGVPRKVEVSVGTNTPDHAMLITGVIISKRKPGTPTAKSIDEIRESDKILGFIVENSWGVSVGKKGFFIMTLDWFRKYAFEIVVPRSIVSPHELALWKGRPHIIKDSDQYFGETR